MPITLTPYQYQELCHGHAWTIENEDVLAEQIASVALGYAFHVQKIIAGARLTLQPVPVRQAEEAIKLLTVNGDTPWHRDGWMFQVISWLAARCAAPDGIIRVPQMIHADKGFDGLQIELDSETGLVTAAIIFEDKATDNPRDTIRDEV